MEQRTLPRNDDQAASVEPWYRQFWPWFIISVPAATVLGCMFTIFLAVTRPDSLVVDDYSRIAETTAQRFRMADAATELGLEGSLQVTADQGAVEVQLAQHTGAGTPLFDWPDTLLLELSHPTMPAKDMDILLTRAPTAGEATYRARLAPMTAERWYAAVVSLGEAAADWRLTGEISQRDGRGRLTPGGPRDDG